MHKMGILIQFTNCKIECVLRTVPGHSISIIIYYISVYQKFSNLGDERTCFPVCISLKGEHWFRESLKSHGELWCVPKALLMGSLKEERAFLSLHLQNLDYNVGHWY